MGRKPQNKLREAIPIPPPAPLPDPETIDVQSIFNEYVSGAIDLIVVLGPTASGKTRYAVELARRLTNLATVGIDPSDNASLRSAPPLASLRSAPVPPLNVPRVAVPSTPIVPSTEHLGMMPSYASLVETEMPSGTRTLTS